MSFEIEIPKSFELGVHNFKVTRVKGLKNKQGILGDSNSYLNTIRVESDQDEVPQTQMEHTFYHEKVHMILDTMNKFELSKDEEFVDVFALLLLQSDKTAVY